MTTVSTRKRLLLRQLNPETDVPLLKSMEIGPAYWEQEVEEFIHEKAAQHEIKGNCSTTLGFDPESMRLVGFLAAATKPLEVDPEFIRIFEISNKRRPMNPVHAAFVTAFGVERRFQNLKYGHELFASFLESLRIGFQRPRFVYLEVYEHSPAAKLYEVEWKFRRLGVTPQEEAEPDRRLRLALDRYQRPKGKP